MPSAGLKSDNEPKTRDQASTRPQRITAAKPLTTRQRERARSRGRGLHAPTKARQITRCGPTAHRESGDSARQFVKPPYEQDACAIISSRQRLLASDTYTGAPTPCGHQNALTGLFCREIHRAIHHTRPAEPSSAIRHGRCVHQVVQLF